MRPPAVPKFNNRGGKESGAGKKSPGPEATSFQRSGGRGSPSGPEARLRDTRAAGRRARAEPCVRDAPAPLRLPTERAPLNREPSVAPLPSEGSPTDVPMPALIRGACISLMWRLCGVCSRINTTHALDRAVESCHHKAQRNDEVHLMSCQVSYALVS